MQQPQATLATPTAINGEEETAEDVPLLSRTPTQVQIQEGVEHRTEKHRWGCRRSPHLLSLVLFITLWVSEVGSVGLLALLVNLADSGRGEGEEGDDNDDSSDNTGFLAWSMVIPFAIGFSYLGYMVEAFAFSKTWKYLKNMSAVEDLVTHIERVRQTPPTIVLHGECYHMETRTRTVYDTTYHSDGTSSTTSRIETYQERVVSHTDSETLVYHRCHDDSGGLTPELMRYSATRIDLSQTWQPADEYTRQYYAAWSDAFRQRNEKRDRDYAQWETITCPGFHENMLAFIDHRRRPWGLSRLSYVLVTVLLQASYLYRIWFDRVTVKAHFSFKRRITVLPDLGEEEAFAAV
jgi:hypothetical protein